MAEVEVERYGYNVAEAILDMTMGVEGFAGRDIARIERQIQEQLDKTNAVRRLKEQMIKASAEGATSLDFNQGALKEAYEAFYELFPDADLLPDNGVVKESDVPDVLRLLDSYTREPTTLIEYLMTIGVVRRVNNLDVMVDCAKEIIKQYGEEIRNRLRMIRG